MALQIHHLVKWNRVSLALGGAAWTIIVLARLSGWIALGDLELILLLAFCVITPLALPFVPLPEESRQIAELARWLLFLQPFATLIGGIALLSERGFPATIEALVWLLFTMLIALLGVMMLLRKSGRQLDTAIFAVALIYVPIGSVSLVLDRLDLQPLGFSQTTVLLTAVHFHFVTLAALMMTGLTGQVIQQKQRERPWQLYRVLTGCMLVAPLLVGTGITVTQMTGRHELEATAATLFALCLILIAFFTLRFIVPATALLLARGLLLVSSASIVFTMLFAAAYALGAATRLWTITISQMIMVHGWVNALVFGMCGLLGWWFRGAQGKR